MRTEIIRIVIASLILVAGAIDDLRSRKVHNWLVLSLAGVALITTLILGRFHGLTEGLLGMGMAFAVCWPLVAMGVLGAGDMKLMMAFGLVENWNATFEVILFSVVWGAIFGLVYIAIQGELISMLKNMKAILLRETVKKSVSLHHIPFTVALIFGWLTFLKYDGVF